VSEFGSVGAVLSYSRLVILPAAIAGIVQDSAWLAAGAVAAAVLTDLADGGIARLLGRRSAFAKDLDSIVDFVFIHCLFVALYATHRIETYQFVVIYAAMLATLTLQLSVVAQGGTGVARTVLGRPVGAIEYAFMLALVAGMLPAESAWARAMARWLFYTLAVVTIPYVVECVVILRRGGSNAGTCG